MRTHLIVTIVIFLSPFCLTSQPQLTLFDLKNNHGVLELSNGVKVPDVVDDNAIFHPSAPYIFFIRRSDKIYQLVRISYEHMDGTDTVLMTSEYALRSLQNSPDKKSISLIRTNKSGSRDLVLIPLDGGAIQTKVEQVDFSHYAWVDDNSLVVVMPGSPNTLRLRSLRPRKETLIAQNVGLSLHRFADIPSVTFIHKQSFDFSTFKRVSEKDGRIEVVVDAAAEQTVFTWTPDRILLSQLEGEVLSFDPKKDQDWQPVKTADAINGQGIKYMAVNPFGDKILVITN